MKSDILLHTSFLNDSYSEDDTTRIYYYINSLTEHVQCNNPTCRKIFTKSISPTNPPKYFHCNSTCCQQNPLIQEQIAAAKTKNGTRTCDLIENRKSEIQEKYGCDFYVQSEEFKQKSMETRLNNGYDHPMRSEKIKQKVIDTNNRRYGCDWTIQSHELMKNSKRKYEFDNQQFDSSVELAAYVYMKDHGVPFEYHGSTSFIYEHNNVVHEYFPDFKIYDNDKISYLEIKGAHFFSSSGKMHNPYDHSQDELYEAKHQCMLNNNVRIIIDADDEAKMWINYVSEKYGSTWLKDHHRNNVNVKLLNKLELKNILQNIVSENPTHYGQIVNSIHNKSLRFSIETYLPQLSDPIYQLKTKIWWILNDVESFADERICCKCCGKNGEQRNIISILTGYRKYCSVKCKMMSI